MSPKKIIMFNNALTGGTGKSILELSKGLVKNGVEVHIIIYEEKIDFIDLNIPNVKIHSLQQPSRNLKKNDIKLFVMKTIANIGDYDLLISNSTPSHKILKDLNLKNKFMCIRSSELKSYKGKIGKIRSFLRKRKYKSIYNDQHLITVSNGLRDVVYNFFKAKPKSIQTIYEPFDFSKIEKLSNTEVQNLPSTPYIIHVGRFDLHHKRQDVLLKAYKQSGISEKLILIGKGKDEYKIRTLINSLGLTDKVELINFTQNPFPFIKHAKLFVLSSDYEGFGRVLVESLALNTPVVSTDCPSGPKEILTGSLSEYLCQPGDFQSLSSKIRKAINEYPPIEKSLLSKFEIDNISKQYLELIQIQRNSNG